MQGPQKEFSSAASPKPSSLTDSRESNENGSGLPEKNVTNHLVSPAVSEAFEAAAARRKIIVERNENSSSSDGHSHKISEFVLKGTPGVSLPGEHLSPAILLYESDYDGEVDGDIVADSYLKADDPSKNYLSLRPNFVRLDRNRCEILNFQEKEGTDKLPGSCNVDKDEELEPREVKDFFPSPGKESIEKREIKENSEKGVEKIEHEDEDEEEDEFEEERGWCLRGVVEFMLLLIAYSLSISYMCSMNPPSPATNSHAICSLKNDHLINQSCTVETRMMKLYDTGFLAVGAEDSYADKVETDEGGILLIKRHVKEEMIQNNAVSIGYREEDSVTDEEAETKYERVDKNESEFKKFAQSIGAKAEENEDDYDRAVEKGVDDSDEDNFDEIDGASETEAVEIEVESRIEILEQVSGPGTRENEDSGGYDLEKKEYALNQSWDIQISAKSDMKVFFEEEKSTHLVQKVDEIRCDDVETEIKGWNTLTIIGVSLAASIVLGSLAFIFGSDNYKPRTTSTEKSRSSREPRESAVEEPLTTVFPAMEDSVKCCARPSLSLSMDDEAFKELSLHIHAPKVELIGELVVGEVNGSCRGYSRKNQITNVDQAAIASNRPGENKITNEGMKNAGEPKVMVTPFRRSSRIRNRAAAMSP